MMNMERIIRVSSLNEAWTLNQERSNVILGGFMWMKMANRSVAAGIDLSLLGLDQIEVTPEEFRIGCMCTLRTLELHPEINRQFPGYFANALGSLVGVQFRNGATIGGSVFGRYGFSDVLTSLLALDTRVELYQGGLVPLADFVNQKLDNDILVRIIIRRDNRTAAYLSQRNTRTDFPVIAVAAACRNQTVYISVGARPMKAALVELALSDDAAADPDSLAQQAVSQLSFGKDMRSSAEYRRHLAQVYIRRGLEQILGGTKA